MVTTTKRREASTDYIRTDESSANRGRIEMDTLVKQIDAVLLREHRSVWAFCSAIEDAATHEGDTELSSRATSLLVQGLREWASHQESVRRQYELIITQANNGLDDLNNNHVTWYEIDSDRLTEYRAKAKTSVDTVLGASYIIGLSTETQKQLFAIVTAIQFKKEN